MIVGPWQKEQEDIAKIALTTLRSKEYIKSGSTKYHVKKIRIIMTKMNKSEMKQ